MNPSDLGISLPGDTWRPGQLETAQAIADSTTKVIVVEGQTGVGKSAIALATRALGNHERTIILTGTYDLQHQYAAACTWGREVFGRPYYRCELPGFERLRTDKAPCAGGYKCFRECEYKKYGRIHKEDILVFTNYAYYLYEKRTGRIPHHSLLICDESHMMESFLMSYLTLDMRRLTTLGYSIPDGSVIEITEWLTHTANEIRVVHERMKSHVDSKPKEFIGATSKRKLEMLEGDIRRILAQPNLLRVEHLLRPVWAHRAYDSLEYGVDTVVLMSATPPPLSALGLLEEDVTRVSVPYEFDRRSKAPVYFKPVVALNRKNLARELPRVIAEMDNFIAQHPGERGLIHTHKYDIARAVSELSRFRHEIVWHQPGAGARKRALKLLKDGDRRMLASPIMTSGIDLPYDECRFIIWIKVPWPDLGDAVVAARLKENPSWYPEETGITMVQGLGRGMRAPDDTCDGLILDASFGRIWKQGKLPEWFKKSVIWERR